MKYVKSVSFVLIALRAFFVTNNYRILYFNVDIPIIIFLYLPTFANTLAQFLIDRLFYFQNFPFALPRSEERNYTK